MRNFNGIDKLNEWFTETGLKREFKDLKHSGDLLDWANCVQCDIFSICYRVLASRKKTTGGSYDAICSCFSYVFNIVCNLVLASHSNDFCSNASMYEVWVYGSWGALYMCFWEHSEATRYTHAHIRNLIWVRYHLIKHSCSQVCMELLGWIILPDLAWCYLPMNNDVKALIALFS